MSQPRKVAQAFDFYAIANPSIGNGGSAVIPFVPVDYKADGLPTGAPAGAKPVLIAHEILISNPGNFAIEVTPATIQSSDSTQSFPAYSSNQKPCYVDPTTFPAVSVTNQITVPAGAIAFPIRVKSFGLTISSPNGATTPFIQAYGPLSLQA